MAQAQVHVFVPVTPCESAGEYIAIGKVPVEHLASITRKIVLLTGLVPAEGGVALTKISPEAAKQLVRRVLERGGEIESYIGHPATAELLSKLFGVPVTASRAMWQPEEGSVALVVRLKRRLPRPGELTEVSEEMLEFWLAVYHVRH